MRDIPVEVLLSFPIPNYTNPETRGSGAIIINSAFCALATCAVALRIYTRVYINRWFGADDLMILIALALCIGVTICIVLANIKYGWDRHVWDVKFTLVAPAYQLAWATKMIWALAAMFVRTALLLFYYRLIRQSRLDKFRIAIHLSMAYSIAVGLGSAIVNIFQCTPIDAYWKFGQGSKCIDEGILTFACGIVSTVGDLLVTLLPIPMISRLQMPLRQRLAVMFLLSLGIVVTIAGVVRSYYTWRSLIGTYDVTWFCYPLWIAAGIEIDLAVICACAPTFRPLLTSFFGNRLSKASHSFSAFGIKLGRSTQTKSATASSGTRQQNTQDEPWPLPTEKSLWEEPYTGYQRQTPTPPAVHSDSAKKPKHVPINVHFDMSGGGHESSSSSEGDAREGAVQERSWLRTDSVSSTAPLAPERDIRVTTNVQVTSVPMNEDELAVYGPRKAAGQQKVARRNSVGSDDNSDAMSLAREPGSVTVERFHWKSFGS